MKVGDLVEHIVITKARGYLGLVLETPETTNNGDYLVLFPGKKKNGTHCSPRCLKLYAGVVE